MRRFLLLAAALLGLVSGAQAQTTAQKLTLLSGQIRPAVDLNFTTGVLDGRITFTRASAETNSLYTDAAGSTFASFGNNVPVFQASGLQIYEARTNSLLNSGTPATQTTGSLGTGTYAFWCIGTGSITSSAGTATATGLGAITCSQGTFQTVAVTVAGTLTFTVSGSVNRFQLELGAFPTPFISTTGTTATRSADVATMTLASIGMPANPAGLTIIGKARTAAGVSAATNEWLASLTDGTTNNRVGFLRAISGTDKLFAFNTAAGVNQQNGTIYAAPPSASDVGLWLAEATNDFAAQAAGQTKITSASNAMPTGLTTLNLGSLNGAQFWNSTIARLQIYNRRLPDAQAAQRAGAM